MPSSDRKNWATYAVMAITVAVGLAILGGVAWRSAPRSWQQMAADAEQEQADAERRIEKAFANVSEEETLPVRERLERAMNEADPQIAAGDLDTDALLRIALTRLGIVGEESRSLRSHVDSDRFSQEAFAEQLLGQAALDVRMGGSYRLLRMRRTEGRTTALYRLVTSQGTVNYHEWMFARGEGGKIRIADVYVYAAGDRLSDSLATLFSNLRVDEKGLTRVDQMEAVQLGEDLQLALAAAQVGDLEAFEEALNRLPPRVRDEKSLLVAQLFAASRRDDLERSTRYLERLRELYPADGAGDVLGWPVDSANGDHRSAIAALDRLDERVGGDPLLALFRAQELIEMKRYAEARDDLTRAIADADGFAMAHFLLVYVSAAEGKYDEAASWARKYADETKSSPQELFDRFVVRRDDVWDAFQRSEAWRSLTDRSPEAPLIKHEAGPNGN